MILKKCINGSMILIDGISEVHVYEKDGFPWVQIQRGKEQTTHRIDQPAFLLNDEGKTIERLPYSKPQPEITGSSINTSNITVDGNAIYKAVQNSAKTAMQRSAVIR